MPLGNQRRHEAGPLEGEIRRAPQACAGSAAAEPAAGTQAKQANRKSGIPQLLQELLKRQYPIRVLYTVGHWLDINSLEDVVQAGNF
jgi:NDP-sugar pyrophosphorylase family protein